MSEEKLVPKLRFNEFEDEWSKYNLCDISTIGKGFTPSTSNSNYWDGDIDWLSIADMNQGKYITETSKKITKEGCKNKKIVKKDTLIMSFKLSMGRLGILKKDMFTNEAICNFKWNNNEILTEYMYYYLSSINILKYGSQAAKGITLNNDTLSTIPVLLPSIKEQNKIANLFVILDKKIELLEKKRENYQDFKKYLLQRVFAEKLNDEWEQFKLKDLLTVKSSRIVINHLEGNSGDYPVFGASGFVKNIDFFEMDRDYISIIKDGSGVGNLSYHEKYSSVVNTSQYLLPRDEYDIRFIFYLLQSVNFLKYATGSAVPHLYFKDCGVEKVYVTNIGEQEKIVNLFLDVDRKIELLEKKRERYQDFKKGLMQQIFA